MKPKVVTHYANIDHPDKCFVYLFKKYTSLCPQGASAFYLQPATHPTDKQWYTLKPVGHNSITKTISRLCKSAGIGGYKTNHSLRATAATRLYESGVDKQMVMEVTSRVREQKRCRGYSLLLQLSFWPHLEKAKITLLLSLRTAIVGSSVPWIAYPTL